MKIPQIPSSDFCYVCNALLLGGLHTFPKTQTHNDLAPIMTLIRELYVKVRCRI